MTQTAKPAAKAEGHTEPATFRDAHAEHHEVVRPGRNRDENGGGEKAENLFWTEHGAMIGQAPKAQTLLRL